ncbi:tetratricopeptide repeat protein [Flavobacterium frigoris]|uniref:Tetratricopeptide repeat family protein n=1 Tax=Flavobacterium frigoris (strain PS1) TaxID=1086011 RepID=H7FMS1_FLAFP|nr:tetratricopeptide repeat protein [Flavobacterium frigoris]EIA10172.1 tetratricopeptide repeat family protein [Flavobacterium frigoris PS1]
MNKFKILSVAFLATVTLSHAQDISEAKKEIDAEKFQNAKTTLKSIIKSDPDKGLAYFLLGNVYLTQKVADSAKISYENGVKAKDEAHFNYIGLGQIDLNANNTAAAKTKFELAIKEMGRRDFEEFVYVAKAYMNADKPDFKAAISTLKRVNEKYTQEPLVLLAFGDAYYGDKNQNEAYSAYRNAFQADNSLIRAKMQLGVLLKGAKAYTEAVKAFNDVIATNPNYGPLYRELAETYYYWAVNVPSRNDEYMKEALSYYEKYMGLTDYSLASRMRHADFLIVARDYKALEIEANKMKEIDNVNPRILRYLGYSAYFNNNVDVAIKALQDYTSSASNNVMSLDYLYLGLSNIKKATMGADVTVAEPILFNKGIELVKKAYDMENAVANDLSEAGKDLYEKKMYKEAAAIFEIATSYKESKNYLLDNFYLGNSLYFDNTKSGAVKDTIALNKADIAFGNVIEASPATQDVYVYRARTNSLLGNDELMIKYYQQYIDIVTKKGAEELAKPAVKTKLIEAYNTMAAGYANTDKVKAIEFFNKTLAMDPENGYAKQSLNTLK